MGTGLVIITDDAIQSQPFDLLFLGPPIHHSRILVVGHNRVMVGLGGYFILFFIIVLIVSKKEKLADMRWLQRVALWTIPLAYIGSQAGWVVAEVGRQPWAIQDMLPVGAAISKLQTGSVQLTFFIFLLLFTVLLFAEIGIMLKAIKKGPEGIKN